MKRHFLGAFATIALLAPAPALAAIHTVTLNGTLVEQTSAGDIPTAPFGVGDTISLIAKFDSAAIITIGADSVASLYYAPLFSLSLGGVKWYAADEYLDGALDIPDPAIRFQNGKVTGFSGWMIPLDARPVLDLGGSSGSFLIDGSSFMYSNAYYGPDFRGTWDFASSSVTSAVPEPASWALMIAGFGIVGGALRAQRGGRRAGRDVGMPALT